MTYQEKNFQTDFNKWCKHTWRTNGVFELKIAKGKSLPFDAVKDHQITALVHASSNYIVYKIPDDAIGQKPFDSFMLMDVPAYVVVMYQAKNPEGEFFMISIDTWVGEASRAKRKSLTEERAREIGETQYLSY